MANYTDPFTGSNTYPAEIGGNWTTSPGFQGMQLYNNKLAPLYESFYDASVAYVNSFTPAGGDMYATVTISGNNGNPVEGGPAVRMSTSASSFYGMWIDYSPFATGITIYKCVAGTFTALASNVAYTPVNGDIHTIRANGSTLTAYVNSVQVLSVSDSDLTTGRVGLWGRGDQYYDDFDGGDLSGSPYTLPAAVSSYALTGVAVNLVASQAARSMSAAAASIAFTDPNKTRLILARSTDVYWSDITDSTEETGYRVKWGTQTGGPYTSSVDTAADVLTANLTGLLDGQTPRQTYYWVVMALLNGVEQTVSVESKFTVGIAPLDAAVSSYTVTGNATGVVHGYNLAAAKGAFIETGVSVAFQYTSGSPYSFSATPYTYTLTGVAVGFATSIHVLTASPAAFAFTPINTVGLTWSGAPTAAGNPGPAGKGGHRVRIGGYLVNMNRHALIIKNKEEKPKEPDAPSGPKVATIKWNYDSE